MAITDLVYIDNTGYHYSDFPSFLAFIQSAYQGIYGADVYLGSDSQDGQFLAILAQAFYDTAALGASVYNSFSPISAQGVGLSRVVKINGLKRIDASYSTADLTIGGTSGTIILNGIAQDTLNQNWLLPASVTIPVEGTIVATATAQQIGAINAIADSITTIFTPTRGWQTVNNVGAATPGIGIEQDATLRVRQSISTADPSLTVFDGTIGGVSNLSGVTAVAGYENDSNIDDANSIPGHSICVVVQGGDSVAICNEIALHKTPGTGTFGDTSETVTDAHQMPLVISFQRAKVVHIQCTVTIATNSAYSSDYADLIKQAIANLVNGIGIGARATNKQVVITQFYAPAYLFGTIPGQSYTVATLIIGKNSGMQGSSNIDIDFDEIPNCDPLTDVMVTVS